VSSHRSPPLTAGPAVGGPVFRCAEQICLFFWGVWYIYSAGEVF